MSCVVKLSFEFGETLCDSSSRLTFLSHALYFRRRIQHGALLFHICR